MRNTVFNRCIDGVLFVLVLLSVCVLAGEAVGADGCYEQGLTLLSQGNKVGANKAFTAAIKADPNNADAYKQRAKTWLAYSQTVEGMLEMEKFRKQWSAVARKNQRKTPWQPLNNTTNNISMLVHKDLEQAKMLESKGGDNGQGSSGSGGGSGGGSGAGGGSSGVPAAGDGGGESPAGSGGAGDGAGAGTGGDCGCESSTCIHTQTHHQHNDTVVGGDVHHRDTTVVGQEQALLIERRELFYNRGCEYLTHKEYVKAYDDFVTSINIHELGDVQYLAHNNKGVALVNMGERERAATAFRDALLLNPNDEQTQKNLRKLGLTE